MIKSFTQPTKWWWPFNITRHMSSSWIHDNHLHGDWSEMTNATVNVMKVFENTMPLSLNHWIAVIRITEYNGDFTQFLIDVASGKDRVAEEIQQPILRELEDAGLDLDKNNISLHVTERMIFPRVYDIDC